MTEIVGRWSRWYRTWLLLCRVYSQYVLGLCGVPLIPPGLDCMGISCATYPCCGICLAQCPMISLMAEPHAKKYM
jgi:hypothetical protein